ncbi:hypothetical protein B0A55_02519 [Friedmanniomyces simplex]|uniref:Uncharacterized protein n=1 Tax=Friedmanniomyces simplex TaxID=329884 RepID=A0A4U0XNW4_9PEZI|nr:hypothetical protein B0A55_02519 [Friedmanniomyces simplex]
MRTVVDGTTGVGDYVNAGLGGSSSGSETIATTAESSGANTNSTTTSTSSPGSSDSYVTTTFSYAPTASPSATVTYLWSNLSMMALTGTNANYGMSTFSLDAAAPCWTQWDQYWSASSINKNQNLQIKVPITTTETYYNNSAVDATYTTMTSNYGTATYTDFTVLSDGNYAYSTSYDTSTATLIETGSFYTDVSTDTANYEHYETSTYSQYSSIGEPYTNVHKPNCTLPQYVPECQSKWSSWIAGASDYMVSKYSKPASTFIDGNSSQVVAPTQAPSNSTVVVSYGGTQLTSPTIYISYHLLYASNSCGPIGPTIRNTIVPLTKSADLASIQWNFLDFDHQWMTEPFNFTDLIEPVPQSIYNKQPSCAVQAVSWVQDSPGSVSGLSQLGSWSGTGDAWWSVTSNFDCPRTGPYRPIIAVPAEVRDLAPEWSSCTVWYGGLYDPPKALQSQSAVATPTMPAAYTTTSASPSSTMQNTQPSQTAGPTQTGGSPAYQASTSTGSTKESATTPVSYGPQPGDAGSIEQTSTATSQDAGGAIVSIIAGASSSTHSQDPTQASSAGDPAVASTASDPSSGSSAFSDPSNTPAAYSDPSDPGATSANPGSETSRQTVAVGQQTTVGSVAISAGSGYESGSDPTPSTAAVIGGETLLPGQATTVDNTPYSVNSEGGVVIGASTFASQNAVSVLSAAEQSATQVMDPAATDPGVSLGTDPGADGATGAVVTGNGQTVTAVRVAPGSYAVGGTTITASQAATLRNGQVLSIGADPSALVVGSETMSVSALETPSIASDEAVLTANGTPITAYQPPGQTGLAVIGGSTLSVGGAAITMDSGNVVSLASNGLVGATETAAFSTATGAASSANARVGAVFTQGGQIYTAVEAVGDSSAAVIGGTTIRIGGPAMTLSGGSVVSLGSSGLVEGSTTIALTTVAAVSQGSAPASEESTSATVSAAARQSSINSQSAAPASTSAQNGADAARSHRLPLWSAASALLMMMILM